MKKKGGHAYFTAAAVDRLEANVWSTVEIVESVRLIALSTSERDTFSHHDGFLVIHMISTTS